MSVRFLRSAYKNQQNRHRLPLRQKLNPLEQNHLIYTTPGMPKGSLQLSHTFILGLR